MPDSTDQPLSNGQTGNGGLGRRLRTERERQKIGVRELSRRLDVSASMISQIETGRVMPSVNTLYSITSVLGISLDDLFAPDDAPAAPRARKSDRVQRAGQRKTLKLGSGVQWELLAHSASPAVEYLYCTYAVGGESAPADGLVRHGGHEYGYVLDGKLGITIGFDTHELHAGDSIEFDSSTPHRLFNLRADGPTTVIWTVVGRDGDPGRTI